MSASGLPFDDIRNLLPQLPPSSDVCVEEVRVRGADLLASPASLGRLQEINEWLAAWQGKSRPTVMRPLVAVFAASHGAHAKGIAPAPASQARKMLEALAAGGGAVNQVCATFDVGLKVFELAIDIPTHDVTLDEGALDEAACAATFAFGMEAIAGGTDLLVLGDLGVGSNVIAAGIAHALYGGAPKDWAPTGANAQALGVIAEAVAKHGHQRDPLELMRRLGGREIAAIAGAIIAARIERIPVLLDGYVAASAAALLYALNPNTIDHCMAASVSPHAGHRALLAKIGKTPLLDLGLDLEDGTGGALAVGIVKAALAAHRDMATRTQAGL